MLILIGMIFSWVKDEIQFTDESNYSVHIRQPCTLDLWLSAASISLLILILFATPLISASRVTSHWRRLTRCVNKPLLWGRLRRLDQELFCAYVERCDPAYTVNVAGLTEMKIPEGMVLAIISLLASVIAMIHLYRQMDLAVSAV